MILVYLRILSQQRFSPLFSSSSFIISLCTFRSVIHFGLIVLEGLGQGSFFVDEPLFVPVPLVEKTFSVNCLCTFVRNQFQFDNFYVDVFLLFCFVLLACVFMGVYHVI